MRHRTVAPALLSGRARKHPPSAPPLLAGWAAASSAASTTRAAAPTPPRASPSCAKGSGAARSPRSSAPQHRSACSLVGPCWHPPSARPLLSAWAITSSAASACLAATPTPPRASPSCARGSRAAPSPRSSAPPHCSARSLVGPCWHLPPPQPLLAAWTATSCVASTTWVAAPTPPRASPSCARGSRAPLSPRSSVPPLRSARPPARPRWHPPRPSPFRLLAAWAGTSFAASPPMVTAAPTSPRASPSCARGSGAVPSPRSSVPPHRSARSIRLCSHCLCRCYTSPV